MRQFYQQHSKDTVILSFLVSMKVLIEWMKWIKLMNGITIILMVFVLITLSTFQIPHNFKMVS